MDVSHMHIAHVSHHPHPHPDHLPSLLLSSFYQAISHPISKYLALTVSTCAYTGTNSVLEIQKLLTHLTEHIEEDEKG